MTGTGTGTIVAAPKGGICEECQGLGCISQGMEVMNCDTCQGTGKGSLAKAAVERNIHAVRFLLEDGADPNCEGNWWSNKISFTGTPFAAAAWADRRKQPNRQILQLLADRKADPNGTYTFMTGGAKTPTTFPAIFGAIQFNDGEKLQFLISLGASLNESTRAVYKNPKGEGIGEITALWNASYGGSTEMVSYLLSGNTKYDFRLDLQIPVKYQDNLKIRYTPLHIAAMFGHTEVIRILIQAEADLNQAERELGLTPLTSAIDHCHLDAVVLLLDKGADVECLFRPGTFWNFTTAGLCVDRTFLDCMFEEDNIVKICACAQALKYASTDVLLGKTKNTGEKRLSHYLSEFLRTPGHTPIHTLQAIFRTEPIKYFDLGRNKRISCRFAPIDRQKIKKIRMAVGPHPKEYRNWARLNSPEEAESQEMKMLQSLGLQGGEMLERATKDTLQPIDILYCVLPDVQKNDEVLHAIAFSEEGVSDKAVFEDLGCQAIIYNVWKEATGAMCVNFMVNLVFAVLFLATTMAINQSPDLFFADNQRWPWVVPLILLTLRNTVYEAMQMLGYVFMGVSWSYIGQTDNIWDVLRIMVTWCSMYYLCTVESATDMASDTADGIWIRALFAVTAFLRWLKLLGSLLPMRWIGPKALPVMAATWEMIPFGTVLLLPFIGSVHMFYTIGTHPWIWRSFFLIYRLVLLGDFDLEELEDNDPSLVQSEGSTTEWESVDPEPTAAYPFIQLFTFFIGTGLTVVMMNIFITVLGNSYTAAQGRSENLFLRMRATEGFNTRARNLAWRVMCGGCRKQYRTLYWGRRARVARGLAVKKNWACYMKDRLLELWRLSWQQTICIISPPHDKHSGKEHLWYVCQAGASNSEPPLNSRNVLEASQSTGKPDIFKSMSAPAETEPTLRSVPSTTRSGEVAGQIADLKQQLLALERTLAQQADKDHDLDG